LELLHDLERERVRLDDPSDAEALHDFRVALRRLRSWIRLLEQDLEGSVPRGVVRRLREYARASNDGRDAEVFAGWLEKSQGELPRGTLTAVRWLRREQEARRRQASRELAGELADTFEPTARKLERRLTDERVAAASGDGADPLPLAARLARLAAAQAEVLRGQLQRVRGVEDEEDAHRARIAGKRLRYILEPLAPHVPEGALVISALKDLQDTLGGLHDAHVWGAALGAAVERAAAEEGKALRRVAAGAAPSRRRPGGRPPSRRALSAVAARMHQEAITAFDAARERWLGDAPGEFFASLRRALDSLTQLGVTGAPANTEIERKYLLSALPAEMPPARVVELVQGYIPGERLVERLRARTDGDGTAYLRTVKLGVGVTRTEVEEETTPAIFEQMWPLTEGRRVRKRRHTVPDGALAWEVDEFTDRDLVLAELELPSEAYPVELPPWLAPYVVREVTHEPEFVNANLAK
jgi:CHAD domain-containing protein/CYTH domain-containing protein